LPATGLFAIAALRRSSRDREPASRSWRRREAVSRDRVSRLLSAEGHPADAVIEMWRPNTDAWALRGHLDSVAATIIDGETASRLRQERLAGSRSREEPCLSIFLCLFYWKPGSNWRCRNIVCAMRDLPMPGSPEINTTQPSHDYVLI